MTNDLLDWYPADNPLTTSDLNEIGMELASINIFNYIFSLALILFFIYGLYLLLKIIKKHQKNTHEHLLKRVSISQSLTIDFIKINKKLYILANNQNSLELLDVIHQEKEILEILAENSENLDKKPLNEKFESALRTILKKSDEVERIKNK